MISLYLRRCVKKSWLSELAELHFFRNIKWWATTYYIWIDGKLLLWYRFHATGCFYIFLISSHQCAPWESLSSIMKIVSFSKSFQKCSNISTLLSTATLASYRIIHGVQTLKLQAIIITSTFSIFIFPWSNWKVLKLSECRAFIAPA